MHILVSIFITEVTLNFLWQKYMPKIKTKETKSKPVGPLILFIGAYNQKVTIWKIGKNLSPWTNLIF